VEHEKDVAECRHSLTSTAALKYFVSDLILQKSGAERRDAGGSENEFLDACFHELHASNGPELLWKTLNFPDALDETR
jgi:hypothetical protein